MKITLASSKYEQCQRLGSLSNSTHIPTTALILPGGLQSVRLSWHAGYSARYPAVQSCRTAAWILMTELVINKDQKLLCKFREASSMIKNFKKNSHSGCGEKTAMTKAQRWRFVSI
ncbi:MAG: hypothetical protein ACREVA_01455 [Burkholderiales bacterium]